jgi:hypothetical protein
LITHHLVAAATWALVPIGSRYRAASLAEEGFVHCTTGADELIATANRYYRGDPQPFVVLDVELDLAGAPWRYDSADTRYPHIYGDIAAEAIARVRTVRRDGDGTFAAIEG